MKRLSCWVLGLTLGAAPAWADDAASARLDLAGPEAQAAVASTLDQSGAVPDYRSPECPGCPVRRTWLAVAEMLTINVVINVFDRVADPGPDAFTVTPETWWTNLKHGFVFDDNSFKTNQFGHPYHGSTYFNSGRANGLSYWESGPLTFAGSFIWECCGETHFPSWNDIVATTMGGMAVGEVLHRLGMMVRDSEATGTGRFFRELGGLAVNPITGFNRLVTGDSFARLENPPDRSPDYLGGALDAGALVRGEGGSLEETNTNAFVEVGLVYGNPFRTRARKPFDQFTMNARFGGGKFISEFNLRGRLYGGHDRESPEGAAFQVNQGFTYISNPAYEIGGQSVEAAGALYRNLSPGLALVGSANLAFVPLGSISAEYVNVNERTYDMGVGGGAGGRATLWYRGFTVAQLGYGLYYIHTVNGSGGEHLAQYMTGQLAFPLFRGTGVGVAGALYLRNSYYPDPLADTFTKHPELRGFLSWRID